MKENRLKKFYGDFDDAYAKLIGRFQGANIKHVGCCWFFVIGSRVIGKDMLVCEAAPYFLQSISLQSCKTSEVFSKRALDLEG